ncbi:B-cell receptor CD22-like [Dendropsophus ebraccatus]|uniref:B-cell receptor CD22-like n=1 Tax=Dendropsophus ebraccatus TaxID=150705 RepID=UPI003831E25F
MEEYRGRTSLVSGEKSCTLRIDPVREEDGDKYYYPGIIEDRSINAYEKQGSIYVTLSVSDKVNVQLHGSRTMSEGEDSAIQCSAEHTCRSSPPSLQWNKPGEVTTQSVEISGGSWREESELTYIPSYVDDGSYIQCTATYPNGQTAERSITLSIKYAPKNVSVTVIGMDEVMEGSDVRLQCNSFSNPGVYRYEWYKGKEKSRLLERGREITVRKVTRDMEPYSCTAINPGGRRESALTHIPVLFAPKNVTVTVIGMDEVMEGSDVTLQCNSFSKFDVYEYEWYKGKERTRLSDIGRKIRVRNVTWDVEPYSCTALNQMGGGESALTQIPVLFAPKNVSVIVIGMDGVMEGSDVALQCNSFSNPDVYEYEWYKGKEKLLERGREITVRNVTRDMEPYSCTARNSIGRGESALTQIPVLFVQRGLLLLFLLWLEPVCAVL